MQIIHQASLAALGLGAAFTVIWGVADPVAALAEVRVIEADGYYIMGDGPEENAAVLESNLDAYFINYCEPNEKFSSLCSFNWHN